MFKRNCLPADSFNIQQLIFSGSLDPSKEFLCFECIHKSHESTFQAQCLLNENLKPITYDVYVWFIYLHNNIVNINQM